MGLIASLVPEQARRGRLEAAVYGAHTIHFCDDWVTLTRACESEPVHLAVFDLFADGRSSFDQVRLLHLRFPRLALLAYVALEARHARDMFDLARCGVDDLVVADVDDRPTSLRAHVDKAEARSAAAVVRPAVAGLPTLARDAVLAAVARAHERLTAETLSRRLTTTRRELTQSLAGVGLPPPNQLLTWGRPDRRRSPPGGVRPERGRRRQHSGLCFAKRISQCLSPLPRRHTARSPRARRGRACRESALVGDQAGPRATGNERRPQIIEGRAPTDAQLQRLALARRAMRRAARVARLDL